MYRKSFESLTAMGEKPWSSVFCPVCRYESRDYHSDDKAKRVCENHDRRFHDGEPTAYVNTNQVGDWDD